MDAQQVQRRKRLIKIAVIALVCLAVVFEISARAWLAFGKKVSGGKPSAAITHYYPELQEIMDSRINGRESSFDVLLLGDAALGEAYGNPAAALQKALEAKGYQKVRVWNLARPGDTSRDSLVKYRWLEGKKFDWVVVYQGIGDLRMSNVAKEAFKSDYSHIGWYNEVDELVDKPQSYPKNKLAAPILWDYIKMKGPHSDVRPNLSAKSVLDKKALEHGASLQSTEPFRRNLKEIINISKDRREFLTLASVATFIDPKYSKEAFDQDLKARGAKTTATLALSYARAHYATKGFPCEVFGLPKTITEGVRAQNEVTSQVAHKQRIDFADLTTRVPASGANFIDVCHFSPVGLKLWAQALSERAPKRPSAKTAGAANGKAAKSAVAHTTATKAAAKPATTGTTPAAPPSSKE